MIKNKKIVTFSFLKNQINKFKKKKKKIILCHGVFDLFHQGHIEHLYEAKKQGDILVVTVTSDQYVNKGPGRPLFNIKQRLNHLGSLQIIDYVTENLWPTAIETIKELKPDIYVKGPDYKINKNDETRNILKEKIATKNVGGKIYCTSGSILSSSNIINNSLNVRNEEENKFINKLKKKYRFNDIKNKINKLSKSNVLLIGDSIIDEYIFSEVSGKSAKEPVLVVKENKREKYIGGVLSMTKLISNFVNKVTLISAIGNNKKDFGFIKRNFNHRVNLKLILKKDAPTINKIRIVDEYSKRNLLGLYKYDNKSHSKLEQKKIIKIFNSQKKNHNQILISDFGHGMISKEIAKKLVSSSNFTSLNAQLNSSNQNDLRFDKYKKTDLLILNIGELKREIKGENLNILMMSKKIKKKVNYKYLVVTLGNKGSYLINFKKNKIIFCPAFGKKIVDSVGAGDVMHALISMCLNNKIDEDLSLFISSIAAAHSVGNLGNSNILNKSTLLRSIKYLLK